MPYYYEDGPTVGDYPYAHCDLAMYEDGGGGGGDRGGGGNGDEVNDGVSSMSGGGSSSSSSNGSDFDDDTSSWTECSVSFGGDTSVSSSGSDTQAADAKKETKMRPGKWLKTLWTIVDRMDKRNAPRQPVKTILRPPTTYKYVIGMSGCPTKVPVYPRLM